MITQLRVIGVQGSWAQSVLRFMADYNFGSELDNTFILKLHQAIRFGDDTSHAALP